MGCSRLLMLGLLLNLSHCSEMMEDDGGGGSEVEIQSDLIAALGEEVHLRCLYRGNASITSSAWKRNKNSRVYRLAGFKNGTAFSRAARFPYPASPTNLTMRMRVSGVDTEGEYICTFESQDEEFTQSMFLHVHVPPQTELLVTEEMDNGIHYQSVRCSANDGKPEAQIDWLINNKPPVEDYFSIEPSDSRKRNGMSNMTSILRFPTHLQDESNITCVVHHPTLPSPISTTVSVATFVAPRVSVQAEMRQGQEEEEEDYWRVSCVASGGRPETHISLVTAADEEEPRKENGTDAGISAYRLPVQTYEGRNVSCVFTQPKLPGPQSRTIRLPSFGLSGVHLLANTINERQPLVELEEGQCDVSIGLEAIGNVPRYAVFCQKEDASPLPSGVAVVGSALTFQAPVGLLHAGLYVCEASYYRHRATVQINITVSPQPVLLPPWISLDLRLRPSDCEVECSAVGAVPAATLSWRLPEGVSAVPSLSPPLASVPDGRHSVTGVLALGAACFPRPLTVGCVIHHPLFPTPEYRSVTIPLCEAPVLNVSVGPGESDLWQAVCDYQAEGVEANLTWVLPAGSKGQVSLRSQNDGRTVRTRLTYRFPLSSHEGDALTCLVEDQSRGSEKRTVHIPKYYISSLRVLNHTTPMKLSHSGGRCILRLSLQKNLPGQRILFEVEGNVPTHSITCQSSNGSFVQMEGDALGFQSAVKGQDEGLYTCLASFYHHKAILLLRVEVRSQEDQLANLVIACVSSVSAMILLLAVALWVFCKPNHGAQSKKQESAAALTALVQPPRKPEKSKAVVRRPESQQYALLVGYCIVSDVKSTV